MRNFPINTSLVESEDGVIQIQCNGFCQDEIINPDAPPHIEKTELSEWISTNMTPGMEYEVVRNGAGGIVAMIPRPTVTITDDGVPVGRRFILRRHEDVSGVSGTGIVTYGIEWPDGTISLRWRGANPSFANWDSLGAVLATHGHDGKTEVEWID